MNKFKNEGNVRSINRGSPPKIRVLVVDDDLETVHAMAVLIKLFGHEVDFAINGFAAIDSARKFRPDIILLDINLPDFKGDKLAQQLRYEPGFENTRIIALSGDAQEATRQRAMEAGCVGFYAKPIAAHTLEALLNGAAERHAAAARPL